MVDSVRTAGEKIAESIANLKTIAAKIDRNTHAGCAMVVAAALDRLLEAALMTRMGKLNSEMKKKLFGDFGAVLASFSAKIDMANALGIIDSGTYVHLTNVRKIRNKFAHSEASINFDSPEIKDFLSGAGADSHGSASIDHFFAVCSLIESTIVQVAGLPSQNLIAEIAASR